MLYDIDAVVATFLPWDCRLKIGGAEHAVLPITLADLGRIAAFGSMPPEKAADFVHGLFASPRPDTTGWTPEQLATTVAVIASHFRGHITKNSQTIAGKVAAAMEAANQPGSGK